MNILYLTGCLDIGGTELYTLDYAQTVRNAGHNVFWATVKDGLIKATVLESGIELLYCELKKRNPIQLYKAIRQLRLIINEKNIDLVHATDAYSALVAALAYKNKTKKHFLLWSNVGIGSASYMLMKKLCMPCIDGIIAVSHFIRNRMIEEGFSPEKIMVYTQCREMKDSTLPREELRKQFGIQNDDVVLGTVGRVVYLKGNRTIIEALPEVISKCPKVKYLIVGDGPEKDELVELSKKLGVFENVIFAGFRMDIENLYNIFDIVVFPTYFEALGYIPYEAMYYQKPIIASLTGGVPELVINEYNGLLVPPAMKELWAEAIIKLALNPDLQKRFICNGTELFNAYHKRDKTKEKLISIYERMLKLEEKI